jgi:hypothetical protein
MDRKTFLTLIPFLPALLKQSTANPNQIHIDTIKRETAKLKALIELDKIQREVDILHLQFKLDRALYEKR